MSIEILLAVAVIIAGAVYFTLRSRRGGRNSGSSGGGSGRGSDRPNTDHR